jgi:membrane fusion protein, multidrug efflux system
MRLLLKLLKRTLPLWILAAGVGVYFFLMATKPVAERRTPPEPVLRVEAVRLQPQSHCLTIESQGSVRARTESTLIPEVSGRVLQVAPNFREGGFFDEGDVLLEIDPSDYLTAVTVSEANLAEARVRLAEEEAQASQAQRDWERLGRGEIPPDLVLRVPQLALARANVAAAQARLQQARRDLERTRITAPYRGRVLTKRVDVGQVVSPGNILAELYAVDYAEIRLPLTSREFAMLDIDRASRGQQAEEADFPVTLTATFGPEQAQWQGRIVRVEGAVDARSRQVFVVAQVDDPYGEEHSQPLKVGLFVEARIQGRSLEDVYVLPRTALREARYVLTIDEHNRLLRVPVEPLWTTATEVVFRDPAITPGTIASVTQMALAIDGMQVNPVLPDAPAKGADAPAAVANKVPVE